MGHGGQEEAGGYSEDRVHHLVLSYRNGRSFSPSLCAKALSLLQKLSTTWFELSQSPVNQLVKGGKKIVAKLSVSLSNLVRLYLKIKC